MSGAERAMRLRHALLAAASGDDEVRPDECAALIPEGALILTAEEAEQVRTLVNLVDTGSTRATVFDKIKVLQWLAGGRNPA